MAWGQWPWPVAHFTRRSSPSRGPLEKSVGWDWKVLCAWGSARSLPQPLTMLNVKRYSTSWSPPLISTAKHYARRPRSNWTTSLTRQNPGPGSPGSGNPVGRRISRGPNRSRRQADNPGHRATRWDSRTGRRRHGRRRGCNPGHRDRQGTVVDATRTAVAVGITAAAAWVLRDEVRNTGARA